MRNQAKQAIPQAVFKQGVPLARKRLTILLVLLAAVILLAAPPAPQACASAAADQAVQSLTPEEQNRRGEQHFWGTA